MKTDVWKNGIDIVDITRPEKTLNRGRGWVHVDGALRHEGSILRVDVGRLGYDKVRGKLVGQIGIVVGIEGDGESRDRVCEVQLSGKTVTGKLCGAVGNWYLDCLGHQSWKRRKVQG